MVFLKGFAINFLVIFFANHILPGVMVGDATKLPHIGADLLFPLVLGFCNALIYPILGLFQGGRNLLKIAIFALGINLIAYAILALFPEKIRIMDVQGYVFGIGAAFLSGFFTNFFEWRRGRKKETGI